MHTDAVRRQVHAALERESRINLHRHPVRIETADGTVTLAGESIHKDMVQVFPAP